MPITRIKASAHIAFANWGENDTSASVFFFFSFRLEGHNLHGHFCYPPLAEKRFHSRCYLLLASKSFLHLMNICGKTEPCFLVYKINFMKSLFIFATFIFFAQTINAQTNSVDTATKLPKTYLKNLLPTKPKPFQIPSFDIMNRITFNSFHNKIPNACPSYKGYIPNKLSMVNESLINTHLPLQYKPSY